MDDTFPEIGDVDISQVVDTGKIIVPEETLRETTSQGKSVESPILMPPTKCYTKGASVTEKISTKQGTYHFCRGYGQWGV